MDLFRCEIPCLPSNILMYLWSPYGPHRIGLMLLRIMISQTLIKFRRRKARPTLTWVITWPWSMFRIIQVRSSRDTMCQRFVIVPTKRSMSCYREVLPLQSRPRSCSLRLIFTIKKCATDFQSSASVVGHPLTGRHARSPLITTLHLFRVC